MADVAEEKTLTPILARLCEGTKKRKRGLDKMRE